MITVEIECEKCNEMLENCEDVYCKICYENALSGEVKEQMKEEIEELKEENEKLKQELKELKSKLEVKNEN